MAYTIENLTCIILAGVTLSLVQESLLIIIASFHPWNAHHFSPFRPIQFTTPKMFQSLPSQKRAILEKVFHPSIMRTMQCSYQTLKL